MSLQPKIRKYRLSFRNKTQILNKLPTDTRIRKLRNKSNFKLTTKQNNVLYPTSAERSLADEASFASLLQSEVKTKSPWFFAFQQKENEQGADYSFLNQKLLVNFSNRVSQIAFIKKEELKAFKANAKLGLSYASSSKTKGAKVNMESLLINKLIDSANIAQSQNSPNISHTSAIIDKVKFGSCGFYFCSSGAISSKFIETIRLIIARKLKKTGRFWIRVCPDTPVTARSAETRMGRGKGAISHYEAKIRPGQMFIEFSGVTKENIKQIQQQLNKKSALPISLLF